MCIRIFRAGRRRAMIFVSYASSFTAVRRALAALVVDSRYNIMWKACKLRIMRAVLVGLILVLILILLNGLGPVGACLLHELCCPWYIMEKHPFGWHFLIFLSVEGAIRNAFLRFLKLSAGQKTMLIK
jgi:hypothetical protein